MRKLKSLFIGAKNKLLRYLFDKRLIYQTKKAYMCLVDFDHEAGKHGAPNTRIFRSIEELPECTINCGAVEVEIKFKRIVIRPIE